MEMIKESEIILVNNKYIYAGIVYSPIYQTDGNTFICAAVDSGNWNKYIIVGPQTFDEVLTDVRNTINSYMDFKKLSTAMSAKELLIDFPCDAVCKCNWGE